VAWLKKEIKVVTITGVPVYLRYTAFLIPAFFALLTIDIVKTAAATFAILTLILAHELGHAAFAKWRKRRVRSIHVAALHGLCLYQSGTKLDNHIIAWGGVSFQAIILIATITVSNIAYSVDPVVGIRDSMLSDIFGITALIFGPYNCFLIVMNLLPSPPLDGAQAWRIIPAIDRLLG
jgi:stage IV sporulation protein FB